MSVTLISRTMPVVAGVGTTAELLAFCARVSSTANQYNHATGSALLRFLIERGEWSPLEMVDLTMEIHTTRDIARQLLRHSFDFQEFSQRYAVADDVPVFREVRLQDKKDRQNSLENTSPYLSAAWQKAQEQVWASAREAYNAALSAGVAKEVARAVLPEGMTRSRMYVKGSVRTWYHYCQVRCDRRTQKEHRDLACEIRDILAGQFPEIADLLPGA